LVAACGARTDLGAPRPTSENPPDSDAQPPVTIQCTAKEKTVLAHGTVNDVDVRIDSAFVYWNDGAHIVRVPKNGGASTVVVDAVVDPGAFDVSPSGVVYAEHGKNQVRRADGTVLGVVSRPSIELVAVAAEAVYVVAPQGKDEALYRLQGNDVQAIATLPLTAPDSLGSGQFPQAAYDLVVDGGAAYVSLIGHAPLPSKVLAVDLGTQNVLTLAAMPLSLPGTSLTVDDSNVYFTSSFGQDAPALFGVSRSGGVPSAVVPTQTYCADCTRIAVASDDSAVYFTAGEFGQDLASWNKKDSTGLPDYVAQTTVDAAVTGIRSDGVCVYWVVGSDPNVYVAPVHM
jgi:hypothetical protein